jgi:predicted nucleotidyltransferase component of viral defense system
VYHSYSDAAQLPAANIRVYALEEIVTEKLRALSGQRKYAVARDLYDLWSLNKTGVKMYRVLEAYPEKCRVKGIHPTSKNLDRLVGSRDEYESNWKNNLEYLVPADLKCSFPEAWEVSLDLLTRALHL